MIIMLDVTDGKYWEKYNDPHCIVETCLIYSCILVNTEILRRDHKKLANLTYDT